MASMSALKIDEVINEVHRVHRLAMSRTRLAVQPVLAIYMDYDYYYECGSEIRGGAKANVNEFYFKDTIRGFEVHRVVAGPYTEKTTHPLFRVVDITPGD